MIIYIIYMMYMIIYRLYILYILYKDDLNIPNAYQEICRISCNDI